MAVERVVGLWAEVWLDGVDISANVGPYLTRLSYMDFFDGDRPDTIEVHLEDTAGLFQGRCYPKKGSALRFEFGFDKPGREIVFKSAAGFEVDEIDISGPPDVVKWKATGQKPGGALHTKKSRTWENVGLEAIAQKIAGEHGLNLVFTTGLDINFSFVYQERLSDLEFLKKLTKQSGISLSLKGGRDNLTLVATNVKKAMEGEPVFEIRRQDVARFRFTDQAIQGAGGGVTRHLNHDTEELVVTEIQGEGEGHQIVMPPIGQSPAAQLQGTANKAAEGEKFYNLTMPGNPRLLSGVKVNLSGWGHNDGGWAITESRHTLDAASGYVTEIKLSRG